jgi:hypothetical protein
VSVVAAAVKAPSVELPDTLRVFKVVPFATAREWRLASAELAKVVVWVAPIDELGAEISPVLTTVPAFTVAIAAVFSTVKELTVVVPSVEAPCTIKVKVWVVFRTFA